MKPTATGELTEKYSKTTGTCFEVSLITVET